MRPPTLRTWTAVRWGSWMVMPIPSGLTLFSLSS
jgi:hypothetical protein